MGRTFCRADRDGDWWIDYVDGAGVRRRERGAPTKRAAERLLQAKEEEAALVRAGALTTQSDVTLDAFEGDFLAWARAHKRPATARRYTTSIAKLKPEFGALRLAEIGKRQVERWMAAQRATGAMPATVHNDIRCLRRALSKAVEWEVLRTNPLQGIRLYRENNARTRFLSDTERGELLRACHGHLRDFVLIAMHTGMRKGEILALKWPDIDWQNGQIAVRDSKNGSARHVPMNTTVRQTLQGIPRVVGNLHLFASPAGDRILDVKTAWGTAVRRAGLADFRIHDLRHTAASYMTMAGVDIKTVAEILGHKTLAMTMRYAHLSHAHKARAVADLDRYMQQVRGKPPEATPAVDVAKTA